MGADRDLPAGTVTLLFTDIQGSTALAEHSPIPLKRIAAALNVDVMNLYGRTRDISALGLDQSTLGRLFTQAARTEGLRVTENRESLLQGARKTWELSAFTVRMLGRIVTGDASLRNISGPLTMADIAGQSAQAGPLVFVSYLALISISLGVLNLLPVPLLDGGHLLYYLAELIKGSPVSDRAFEVGQRIGMAMLAVLIALALFNDVSRLF